MPKIAVLTSYMHQRNGDLVSAINFIKSMLAQHSDLEFELIIKRDISSHQKDLEAFKNKELGELAKSIQLTVLDSSDYQEVTRQDGAVRDRSSDKVLGPKELAERSNNNWGLSPNFHGWEDVRGQLSDDELSSRIKSSSLIAVVGNPHRLVKSDYQFLKQFERKIITIPEYDLAHVNDTTWGIRGTKRLNTGFKGEGVYINETVKSKAGFRQLDNNKDAGFLNYLLGEDAVDHERYHQKSALFYGYFNDDSLSDEKYTVHALAYIQQAIMLAIDSNKKKQIDIVIPGLSDAILRQIYKEAVRTLPETYKSKLGNIQYAHKSEEGDFEETILQSQDKGAFNLRLINPKQLQRDTVQALLNEAEPFLGLTGDASWIEGLIKGKVTCYQTMNWKKNFYNGFMEFLDEKFPKKSPLYQFYALQAPDPKLTSEERFNQMRALYIENKRQMLHEATILARHIESEKNISKTIIPRVISEALTEESRLNLASFVNEAEEAIPEEVAEEYLLTEGPLPKSIYTCQLEALTRKLLNNIPFKIMPGTSFILFENEEHPYNLKHIFKYANLEHLRFEEQDFEGYLGYLKKGSLKSSNLGEGAESLRRFNYPDLHVAEMHAINIYTSSYYRSMNALLRGQYSFSKAKSTKDVILHTVFCGSALSKVPDNKVERSSRGESIYDQNLLNQKVNLAKTKGVTEFSGFVSTGIGEYGGYVGSVKYIFTNLRGKYVSPLSHYPNEREYLIPPTMIQISKYTKIGDQHIFDVSPVTDLAKLNPEKQMTTVEELRDYNAKNLLRELTLYLKRQVERINSPTFLNWLKSKLFDTDIVKEKINTFYGYLDNLTQLKEKLDNGEIDEVGLLSKLDNLSREIETTASIRTIKNPVYASKTTSAKNFSEIKALLKELKSDQQEAEPFERQKKV